MNVFSHRSLSWLLPALCVLALVVNALVSNRATPGFDFRNFGTLPVVANGRVQPIDSLARNHLLAIHATQRVPGEDAPSTPAAWLAELAFRPAVADTRKIFLIHHDDILGLTGLTRGSGKSFSLDELRPAFPALQREAARIEAIDAQKRSAYEKALIRLTRNLFAYNQLKHALSLPRQENMEAEFGLFLEKVVAALAAADQPEPPDAVLMDDASARMRAMLEWVPLCEVFTTPSGAGDEDWRKLPDSVIDSAQTGSLHPAALAYARMGDAYRAGDGKAFDQAVADYKRWLHANRAPDLRKSSAETVFNRLAPFYQSMAVYVVAFLCAAFSWLRPDSALRGAAFRILLIGFCVHTAGLITRMVLEGRPPVTNLYSSAVFIGWGVIVMSIVLEISYRNAIGTAVAAVIGFGTLLIAHHLSLSGDTLEMMRAVLDTNFWLATHVVIITLGYSSCFLAGFLAIVWILRRACGDMSPAVHGSLRGMVYGVICFATLASFVGTVLGGIWADQSWGRFWGWDPKENGALLIVLWNAIILHARWGGLVRERGMMVMAVFGNIVTAWSWFGTNMLGIGLHSYGFTDAAFLWLLVFISSQIVLMALAWIPKHR
jgi:ABC-type transport system involved in cytochrome c biogenesis permease subunit